MPVKAIGQKKPRVLPMRVFISYHTADLDAAIALKNAIEQAIPGIEIFLDVSSLRFGYNWQPALYEAIEKSDAFVTLVGNRLGNWQTAEYYAAHDKKVNKPGNFILLPIVIADRSRGPAPNLPGLSQLHWIECAEPTAPDVLPNIIRTLSGEPTSERPKPWVLVNPYRGLMALEEQDADFFFGREHETEQTVEAIVRYPNRVISLIGNSGVGKSSLVQAGVISALKRQRHPTGSPWPEKLRHSREWAYFSFRPEDDPVKALVTAFVNLWFPSSTDVGKYKQINEWAEHLMRDGSLLELFDASHQRFVEQNLVAPKKAFVYVDQGEELYNRGSDTKTLRVSHLIAEAAKSDDFVFMLSQRSDYYGDFQGNRELFDIATIVDVAPMKPDELISVLREPASRLQVTFYPPELPEQLVDASRGQLGALALLADLMIDAWSKMQKLGKEGVIRAFDEAPLIDVEKPLASRADRFLVEHAEDRPTIERLFVLRLVKIYEQGTPFRRRVYEKDCTPAEWKVLNALSAPEWRLVVTGVENSEAFAEVAHDILLAKWPALGSWITRERQFLLWRTDTDREFNRWLQVWLKPGSIPGDAAARPWQFNLRVFEKQDIGNGDKELLKGERLQAAIDTLARRAEDIDPQLKMFIKRSDRVARAEEESNLGLIGTRVFISFSRVDLQAADTLKAALEARGFRVVIDRQDIVAGEDWETRLSSLIAKADTLVFLISPDSLKSAICSWELEEASRSKTRIVPLIIRPVEDLDLPVVIRNIPAVFQMTPLEPAND